MGWDFVGGGGGGGVSDHSALTGVTPAQHHDRYTDAEAISAVGTHMLPVFAYAGAEPSAGELAAALTALDDQGIFKKGATDPSFFGFRHSTVAGGLIADFSVVEMV